MLGSVGGRYNSRVMFRFRATVGNNGSDQRFFSCALGFFKLRK